MNPVAGGRFAFERGIRYSSLLPISRHLALTLATWADLETGIIPDRFQPAKETLEQATGLSRGAIVKHLNLLEEAGWLRRETGGGRSRRTKFRLCVPPGAKTGHETAPFDAEYRSSGDPLLRETGHVTPETGHVVNENGSPGDPKSPCSSGECPPPPEVPSEQPTGGGGGGDDQQEQAAAFLAELPGRWAAGRATAKRLAPLLLEAAARQGWSLDGELAARLTEDLGPVRSYPATLAFRISDLPKNPTAHQPQTSSGLPPWCGSCGDGGTAARSNLRFRTVVVLDAEVPCPDCHPDSGLSLTRAQ